MLDVARIETNSFKLDRKRFDLNELVSAAIDDARKQMEEKPVKLMFDPACEIMVFADRRRIAQVIFNLLSNAIKFTEGGEIRVTLERKGDESLVQVADSGTGIGPDMFPLLFTKFATNSDSGTGVGLYIAKSTIEAHGGRILTENNKDGKGTIFTFTVPAVK